MKYTSRSLECHIAVPRAHAWEVFLAAVADGVERVGGEQAGAQTVLSLEPPWRRSYRLEGELPLDFYEGTFVFRDDGDECHLSWGVVVDPEPTEAGWEFLAAAMDDMGAFMARVAEAAQA